MAYPVGSLPAPSRLRAKKGLRQMWEQLIARSQVGSPELIDKGS